MPTVPNYVGKTLEEAKAARDAAGFSGGTYTGNGDGNVNGNHLVVSQTPAAGSTQAADGNQSVIIAGTHAWWLSSGMIIWGS